MVLVRSEAVVAHGLLLVLRDPCAVLVADAEVVLGSGVVLVRGEAVVAHGLLLVLRDPCAVVVAEAEAVLGSGVVLVRSEAVVAHGLHLVLRDPCAVLVAEAEAVLGISVVLVRSEAVVAHGLLLVLLDRATVLIAVAEPVLGARVALLCSEADENKRTFWVLPNKLVCAVLARLTRPRAEPVVVQQAGVVQHACVCCSGPCDHRRTCRQLLGHGRPGRRDSRGTVFRQRLFLHKGSAGRGKLGAGGFGGCVLFLQECRPLLHQHHAFLSQRAQGVRQGGAGLGTFRGQGTPRLF